MIRIQKFVIYAVIAAVAMIPLAGMDARADIVTTQEALDLRNGEPLERVDAWLLRDDVQRQLAELGVDPELARIRAAALSPEELEALAGQLDEAPAGAGVLEIIGATFVVLLVLDLMGVINIFTR